MKQVKLGWKECQRTKPTNVAIAFLKADLEIIKGRELLKKLRNQYV